VGLYDTLTESMSVEAPDGKERDEFFVEFEFQLKAAGGRVLVSYCSCNDQLFTPDYLSCSAPLDTFGGGIWSASDDDPTDPRIVLFDERVARLDQDEQGLVLHDGLGGQEPWPLWGGDPLFVVVTPEGRFEPVLRGVDGAVYRPWR